ncbi:Transporter [Tenacibaculum sp. 190524A02b]|uniref:Transporter n=1 Tax=Tenacibaculum vairaonense TaxID=3137860 RepID=A0ABP1F5U4_9FLAO
MKTLNFIITLLLLSLNTLGQEDKKKIGSIATDRPDQSESTSMLPKKFFQVETGGFYESVNDVNNYTYNTTLLRYGLLDNFELRVAFSNTESFYQNQTLSKGFSPLTIGGKVNIAKENKSLPEITLVGHLNLPFLASKDYKTINSAINFRFAFSHTLNEKSSLSYNLGMAWNGNTPEPSYIYTLSYGHSISSKIGWFLEVYGDLPESSMASHKWDTGFLYLFSDNLQFDISGGTGITNNTQDLYLSAGLSFRLPQ